MPTPFPGMDPYLERADIWPNVHNSLVIAMRDELAPLLRPRYYVAVEECTVRVDVDDLLFAVRPDVAVARAPIPQPDTASSNSPQAVQTVVVELPVPDDIHEVYLEIRDVGTDQVITVVEFLAPTNKVGEGRRQYEHKRRGILGTLTHLVEIDLLRFGQPMPMRGYAGDSDYRILVSRAEQRPRAELLPFGVRQPIPSFHLPLQTGDNEPEVHLNSMLHALYDRAGYDLRIDYRTDPQPPLKSDDAAWTDALLRAAGLR